METSQSDHDQMHSFTSAVRSDYLAQLRQFIEGIPALRGLGLPLQLRLVLDANAIFRDLRWLCGRRRNPEARTSLQELISSRTVVAFAPLYVEREVQVHAVKMAEGVGVSADHYLETWETYKRSLILIPTRGKLTSEIDPKDVAYIEAYEEIGAHGVLSDDIHIAQMGANAVSRELVVSLVHYSRAASCYYSIWIGGTIVTISSWQIFMGGMRGLLGLWQFLLSTPRWMQVTLLAACVAAIAHPRLRDWLLRLGKESIEVGKLALQDSARVLAQIGAEAFLHAKETECHLRAVKECIQPRRISLRICLRAVCLTEARPMSLPELARRVQATGYVSRNSRFTDYVRRVLRGSSIFEKVDGKWVAVA